MTEVPELRRHARAATSAISVSRERGEAAEELYEHALSQYEEARSTGLEHDAAVREVVAVLGDPTDLARDFGRAHRQPITPATVALLILAVALFFCSLWALVYLLLTYQLSTLEILLAALAICLLPGSVLLVTTLIRRKR